MSCVSLPHLPAAYHACFFPQALACIRVRDVSQIQLESLRQCTSDKSAYVRKVRGEPC
jgi:hypothetical protein